MTITITDAAFGLAETTCGTLLVGAFVAALAGCVLEVIKDIRLAERDEKIRGLRDEVAKLGRDCEILKHRLADSRTGSDGYKAERDEYIDRIEYAIATLKGEHEDEDEEQS